MTENLIPSSAQMILAYGHETAVESESITEPLSKMLFA
jgi:hypothetical protein